MRLLLDTHALLWWIADDERLSVRAAALIADGSNQVFVSAASAWEIVVKSALGRVEVPTPVDRFLTSQLEANAFVALPIQMRHALGLAALPDVHRDPFDRILVAQAVAEDLTLVSRDSALRRYPVAVEW
ncbi:MAG TPA: type II toxin-antitoxin system VapC family toxin [Actinomycetota bacterium]|nr:type II toxin-antitoxin system VapC family toxin [Actinomycetota bacterium]